MMAVIGCHADSTHERPLQYPVARRDPILEQIHGVDVADPYRWLEDADSDSTRLWVDRQNELTEGLLSRVEGRDRIRERLTAIWNHERHGIPTRIGPLYLFEKNDGLQNQSVLYGVERLGEEPRLLLDPNLLSADGTVSLQDWSVSEDGHYLAYGISTSGSDWSEWRIRDIVTGADLDDRVQWVKFSTASWTPDSHGFYYSRYDEPEEGEDLSGINDSQKLYYHAADTPQSDDRLVYERSDEKEWGFDGKVTEDGLYLVIHVWKGSSRENGLFYKSLASEDAPVVALLDRFDAQYDFIGNDGPLFWLKTDLDAPLGRVIAIDIRNPAPTNWVTLIPESSSALRRVSLVADRFIARYLVDAHSSVRLYRLDGEPVGEVGLPGIGTAGGFTGRRAHSESFYSFESFTTPKTILKYDFESGESTVLHRREADFDSGAYDTEQVFYASKDGTSIPMFVTHRRGLERDGNQPTYLYGYGGFNVSMTPTFSTSWQVWLEMGGILAVANLRGGGEYGKAWHDAGRRLNKQNGFDDFIAAAEWLIANGYTSRERLAIGGASNGGLLVGACVTQRPGPFGGGAGGGGVTGMPGCPPFSRCVCVTSM